MVCSLKLIVIRPFAPFGGGPPPPPPPPPPPTSSTGGKGVARGDGRHFPYLTLARQKNLEVFSECHDT